MVDCSFNIYDDSIEVVAWIEQQFNNHRLFRRLLIIYACALTWHITELSFTYATTSGLTGLEISGVIGTIQGSSYFLLGYLFKGYVSSADKG